MERSQVTPPAGNDDQPMDGQEELFEEPAEEVEGSALGGSGFRVPLRQPQASAEDDADAAEYADHFARTIMQFKRGSLPRSAASLPEACLLYTSPSPRDGLLSRMPSSA